MNKRQSRELSESKKIASTTLVNAICSIIEKVESIFGKNDNESYKIEIIDNDLWVVRHTEVEYEDDDVTQLVRVIDL